MGVYKDGIRADRLDLAYSTAQLEIINERAAKRLIADTREYYNTHHRPQEPTIDEIMGEHTPEWEPDLVTKHRLGDFHDIRKYDDYRWRCKCNETSSRTGRYYDDPDGAFRAFLEHKYDCEWYVPPARFKRLVGSLAFQAISAILVINGLAALVYWITTLLIS
jgi:hypothetical protein